MPPANASLREQLVTEIVARLAKIAGGSSYWFDIEGRVVRFEHRWDGDKHVYQGFEEWPSIVVYEGEERFTIGTREALGVRKELTLRIEFEHVGGETDGWFTSEHANRMVRDLSRALFRDKDTDEIDPTGIGIPIDNFSGVVARLEPSEEKRTDGVAMDLVIVYTEQIGDPDASPL